MALNSALQNRKPRLDLDPAQSGEPNITVTNSSTHEAVLPMGTVIPPGGSRAVSVYEWSLTPGGTRTAFSLA